MWDGDKKIDGGYFDLKTYFVFLKKLEVILLKVKSRF